MSADFWAGYLSGAVGIIIGNPLDLLKTRLQATTRPSTVEPAHPRSINGQPLSDASNVRTRLSHWTDSTRGVAAPILSYGALNALLYMTYNRTLALLTSRSLPTTLTLEEARSTATGSQIWLAGAVGGLATFVVSAPAELIKCRAQVSQPPQSSLAVARDLWHRRGLPGFFLGAGVTSLRDALGYGFYFWSYELSTRALRDRRGQSTHSDAAGILLCGGLAGIVTWVSIFPLDVIKTRVQTYDLVNTNADINTNVPHDRQPLVAASDRHPVRPSTWQIAAEAYRKEGAGVFVRGLGVCVARAFVVNAVQWAIYEWTMKALA